MVVSRIQSQQCQFAVQNIFLLFVNKFSKKISIYFLKKKSAFVELKKFKATIKRCLGARPCSPSWQPGTHVTQRKYLLWLPFELLSGHYFQFVAEPINITMQTKCKIQMKCIKKIQFKTHTPSYIYPRAQHLQKNA